MTFNNRVNNVFSSIYKCFILLNYYHLYSLYHINSLSSFLNVTVAHCNKLNITRLFS